MKRICTHLTCLVSLLLEDPAFCREDNKFLMSLTALEVASIQMALEY